MLAHIYQADGHVRDEEVDTCYRDRDVALTVCRQGCLANGDRAEVCVTTWNRRKHCFDHRIVRVAVRAGEIHVISNTNDCLIGKIDW